MAPGEIDSAPNFLARLPAASYRISIILNFGVEEGQFYASPCITLIGHCIHGGISIDFPARIDILLIKQHYANRSWSLPPESTSTRGNRVFEDGEFSGLLLGKKWRESG